MTVAGAKLFSNRDVYEITYDKGDGEGVFEAVLTNPETGDTSGVTGPNDGVFTVSVGGGYDGVSDVVVADVHGHELDSGTVTFGEGAPEVPEPPDGWPEHPIAGPPASPAHPIVLPDEPHPEPH